MCQDIKDCILRGDIGRWASHLHLASAYANTMLLEWFQHNFCRREICSVEVEMERLSQGTYCMITCVIQIFYQTGYRFHETVTFYIDPIKETDYKIVQIYNPPTLFQGFGESPGLQEILQRVCREEEDWWNQAELSRLLDGYEEKSSYKVYSRAVHRSALGRASHPEIECAVLLSCAMSMQSHMVAHILYRERETACSTFQRIYNWMVSNCETNLYKQEKKDTWESKFVVPWFSMEECAYLYRKKEKVPVECNTFMSFFYVLLFLLRIPLHNLMQLRLDGQDKLIVDVGETYVVSRNDAFPISERPYFAYMPPERAFGIDWVASARKTVLFEQEDGPLCVLNKISGSFHTEELEHLLTRAKASGQAAFQLSPQGNPRESSRNFCRAIFQYRKQFPDSIFSWAVYAFQSLFVPNPQVYVYVSVKSKLVQAFAMRYGRNGTLLFLHQCRDESIFVENHRIMTADQVIRCKTGDAKSRALLFYSVVHISENISGGVILTDCGVYAVFQENAGYRIYDMEQLMETDRICGKVKAAISEKEGEIYPDKLPETCRIPAFLEAFMKGEKADAV